MDPLSVIGSIAGVAQAGASLSKMIYEIISTVRGAPKEIADIARGIADLSVILSELRRVLNDGLQLFRRKLIGRIRSAMRRIDMIHNEIGRLMDINGGVGRLKWVFRRSMSVQLLHQVEAHKNAINMILHTMTLAVQIKLTASTKQTSASDAAVDERDLKLQQTENVVQASYQSLRELKETEFAPDRSGEDATDDEPAAEDYGQNQLMLWRDSTGDTAGWLYAVVFSAYAECRAEGEYDNDHGDPSEKDDNTHSPSFNSGQGWVGDLSLRVTQKPINPRKVVDELLAEWTELSNDEIKGSISEDVEGQEEDDGEISKNIDAQEAPTPQKQTERQVQEPVQQMRTSYENRHTGGVEVIDFKDAVGRKFTLPYHEIRRWRDMEEIVKQAFLHVDIVGPHVQEGRYDLIGSDGRIILPILWEKAIKPGEIIEMRMWPMDKPNIAPRPSRPFVPQPYPTQQQARNGIQNTHSPWRPPMPVSGQSTIPPLVAGAGLRSSTALSPSQLFPVQPPPPSPAPPYPSNARSTGSLLRPSQRPPSVPWTPKSTVLNMERNRRRKTEKRRRAPVSAQSSQTSFTSESSDDEDNESTVEAASVPTKPRKTEKPEEQSEEPEKKKKNIVTRFGLWLSK
ncbi:hypothetical protein GQ607_003283 [Colletotrichum asianum]|uniref:Ubiquitin-like domain-containing protein n=1 Tax=Colletotrichum asianum TaxID=702518 RepID=A0A8H3ZR22_9PEZI|nr:hypothetical protein GQ607_003283 [Colletotrichum asianum]